MNMYFKTTFFAWLSEKYQALGTTITQLEGLGRSDEANLKKAARNIYGIFMELLKTNDGYDVFDRMFDQLSTAWQQARVQADAHGDFARVTIEDEKLAALADVRRYYDAIERKEQP